MSLKPIFKIVVVGLLILFSHGLVSAKTNQLLAKQPNIKSIFSMKNLDTIVARYWNKLDSLNEENVFYLGRACAFRGYAKMADTAYLKYCSFDSLNSEQYYRAGNELMDGGMISQCMKYFQKAARLAPDSSKYFTQIGFSYMYVNNTDSAKYYCLVAEKKKNPIGDNFFFLGNLFNYDNMIDSAVYYYNKAMSIYGKNEKNYKNCLLILANIEFKGKHYEKAEKLLKNLIDLDHNQLAAVEKLLQIKILLKEFPAADTLKKLIYDAFNNNNLPEEMSSMFCYSELHIGDKILSFNERYAEPPKDTVNPNVYWKQIVYVMDTSGNSLYRICAENNKELRKSGNKYTIVAGKMDEDDYYGQYTYKNDIGYSDFINAVTKIIEGKIKPSKIVKKENDDTRFKDN